MVNISDIKAELKAWERDFKLQHGTQPTKSDINDCPTIGELTLLDVDVFSPSTDICLPN
jgi:hypothetical protein